MKPSYLIIAAMSVSYQIEGKQGPVPDKSTIEKGEVVAAIDTTKTKLSDKQKGNLKP
jgi:hypothetical protein